MRLDSLNGSLYLRRTDAGSFNVSVEASNSVGSDVMDFNVVVVPTYEAVLDPVRPERLTSARPVTFTGRVKFKEVLQLRMYYYILPYIGAIPISILLTVSSEVMIVTSTQLADGVISILLTVSSEVR